MILLPQRLHESDFAGVIAEAADGHVVAGPWNERFALALEGLANGSASREQAERALEEWVREWNASV